MRKTAKLTAKYLDKLIEENLALPFVTKVLGQEVTVAKVEITKRDQIVAICLRGKAKQAIPILDLPMPDPRPEGAEWIDAYRRWHGN